MSRVVVVGVTGSSASGKTTLAALLSKKLNSPTIPISMDWFFRPEITQEQWELKAALNCPAYLAQLKLVVERAAAGRHLRGGAGDEWIVTGTSEDAMCKVNVVSPNYVAPAGGAEPVTYIVTEGYHLFSFAEIAERCVVRICVAADKEVCAARRFLRENDLPQSPLMCVADLAAAAASAATQPGGGDPADDGSRPVELTTLDPHPLPSRSGLEFPPSDAGCAEDEVRAHNGWTQREALSTPMFVDFTKWYSATVWQAFEQGWGPQMDNAANAPLVEYTAGAANGVGKALHVPFTNNSHDDFERMVAHCVQVVRAV
jgi:uridine kinase